MLVILAYYTPDSILVL